MFINLTQRCGGIHTLLAGRDGADAGRDGADVNSPTARRPCDQAAGLPGMGTRRQCHRMTVSSPGDARGHAVLTRSLCLASAGSSQGKQENEILLLKVPSAGHTSTHDISGVIRV